MPVANGVACTLVSRVQATALFGHPATKSVPADPGGAASVCLWKADAAPGTVGDVAYLLQVHVYADALHYSEKVYPNARLLSDIGDRAIAVDEGMGIYAVQFVKGGRTVTIAYSVNAIGGDTHAKAATQSNEVIALARTAAGRM